MGRNTPHQPILFRGDAKNRVGEGGEEYKNEMKLIGAGGGSPARKYPFKGFFF